MKVRFGRQPALALLLCCFSAGLSASSDHPQPGDTAISVVVVTVLTKKSGTPPVVVEKGDVIVREGGVRKNVTDWIPARGDHAALQLAIVVDEASPKTVGGQFQSLKKFILAQPPSTAIGIYYALGDGLRPAIQMTMDHKAAAAALRPPLGSFGDYVSPYSAVSRLIVNWPLTMARREILLLTPGFDLIHHTLFSPDANTAIEQAQKSGILIHPILVNPPRRFSPYSEIGRSTLTQVADETGGTSLVEALSPPLSMPEETGGAPIRDTIPTLDFGPVLKRLSTALANQYFLVWKTAPSKTKDGELRSFALRTEDNGLRITAPAKAFVP
jgi:hypothetical protein